MFGNPPPISAGTGQANTAGRNPEYIRSNKANRQNVGVGASAMAVTPMVLVVILWRGKQPESEPFILIDRCGETIKSAQELHDRRICVFSRE